MRSLLGRWHVAAEALAAVVVMVGIKCLAHTLGWEYLELNSLFTSLIGGTVFVFGMILAGTLSDFKESERIPSEITALCGSLAEDSRYCKAQYPEFDAKPLLAAVHGFLVAMRADLADKESRSALDAIAAMTPSLLEMERIGLPANHVVRLKGEQAALRRTMMRLYYIQRIDFLPSAYNFVRSLVFLILALLMFTMIEPVVLGATLVGFITYLFIYIMRLLRTLDTPFRTGVRTNDDVSLFLIREMEASLAEEIARESDRPAAQAAAATA